MPTDVPYVPLSYIPGDSESSTFAIIHAVFPDLDRNDIEFVKLTQGISNTVLKMVRKSPNLSKSEIEEEALLLRTFVSGTEILIDRKRELACHALLSQHGLASTLLARFENGILHKFLPGRACSEADITCESIWRGVARTMGHWHAVLPTASLENGQEAQPVPTTNIARQISTPGKPLPNIWTLLQNWINAMPIRGDEDQERLDKYQSELERLVRELGETSGLGGDGFVFSHNDLLAGNIIVRPAPPTSDAVESVDFIDYEYAIPAPAAFEICSHFSEWAGYKCDYTLLPTRSVRREFLREYIKSYDVHRGGTVGEEVDPARLERFLEEVDKFRAIPSLFWGICSYLQANLTSREFNHSEYSDIRLGEYWAWREETDGIRAKEGKEVTLRERRWAQEA